MTTEMHDALAKAAADARADFEARDVSEVIAPASRRVRRSRATLAVAGAFGIVAVAGGLMWGVDALSTHRSGIVDPATPSEGPPDAIERLGEVPWSTLSLAAVTEPRTMGDKRIDSVAGMICHHEEPTDDPRVYVARLDDPNSETASVFEDCEPVWFKDGPFTQDTDTSVTTDAQTGTVTSSALIHNQSARPIAIDSESVFIWVETDPLTASNNTDVAYSGTVVGKSMWDTRGSNQAFLQSGANPVVIAPGETYDASTRASDGIGYPGPLAQALAGADGYTVTYWARIHEDNPSGDATYLIQLGSEHSYGAITN